MGNLIINFKELLSNSLSKIKELNNSQDSLRTDYNRLKNSYHEKEVLKLHFGCGPRILKGWINIDLIYEPYEKYMIFYTNKFYPPEIRGDRSDFFAFNITKTGLPLPENSVDVIFHEDFFEHLTQKEQILFLAEVLRVQKKGSIHRINTPNLISSMKQHSYFSKGFSGVYVNEWENNNHYNLVTVNYLKEIALMVGYDKVLFTGRDQSYSELVPLEYRPDPNDRLEDGNIFADLIK